MVLKGVADKPLQGSYFFTIRLWLEDLGNGQADWRGKVQHVNSGEARYFRDWQALQAFIEGIIATGGPEECQPHEVERTGGEAALETGTEELSSG